MLHNLFAAPQWGHLPDVVIIGAPKCATTSLYAYLSRHELFAPARRKEVHYFDENFERGPDWYRRQFPAIERPQITGEASTAYLFSKPAPARAAALVPAVKIVAILRDPVRRVLSHYWHNVRRGRLNGDFDSHFREALSANHARETSQARLFTYYPVQWGFYREQIERWFGHFPREQFLFLRFETFVANTGAEMRRVFQFLELPSIAIPHGEVFNASPPYAVADNDVTRRLAEIYRKENAGLDRLIGPEFVW